MFKFDAKFYSCVAKLRAITDNLVSEIPILGRSSHSLIHSGLNGTIQIQNTVYATKTGDENYNLMSARS